MEILFQHFNVARSRINLDLVAILWIILKSVDYKICKKYYKDSTKMVIMNYRKNGH